MIKLHISSAFTLIELLVTITIVSILASISVASYNKYRESAYSAETGILFRDLRTAGEAALVDLNLAGCIDPTDTCFLGVANNPFQSQAYDIANNASRNFLADYISPKLINTDPDAQNNFINTQVYFDLSVFLQPPHFASYQNLLELIVFHCQGNSAYEFVDYRGQNAGNGSGTEVKMTKDQFYNLKGDEWCQ